MSRPGLVAALMLATLAGCAARGPQLATVPEVDLERFMGDWYVIAHIPAFVERNAFNAVESYKLDGDRIETTFTFRNKAFDGPEKQYEPNAIVADTQSNAVWGMQFVCLPTKVRTNSDSRSSPRVQCNGVAAMMFSFGPVRRWAGVVYVPIIGCSRPLWH